MFLNLRIAPLLCSALLACTAAQAQVFTQQGSKLVGTPNNAAQQGWSVALSADGNTALIGGNKDSSNAGAVWIFVRDNSGNWTQQGSKLPAPSDATGSVEFGWSAALSGDGNTALIGGPVDSDSAGAAWVFTRDSNGNWTEQQKLVANNLVGAAQQGSSVALSADGNTALIGGSQDNSGAGAAWIFTRSNGGSTWTQGSKLVGGGSEVGAAQLGYSVGLSGDGKTALIGAPQDSGGVGAAFVFTNSVGTWTQGSKLAISGGVETGYSVALSGDGNTALLGGPGYNSMAGAAWVFVNSGGNWTQQGSNLASAAAGARQGTSVALSNDGNTALFGGPGGTGNGAAWVFTRNSSTWSQAGSPLVGSGTVGSSSATQGQSVALSADGNTALIGGNSDNNNVGAAWPFTRALSEALQFVSITPCRIVDTRNAMGPFGGPEISGQSTRTFNIPSSACSIPSSAAAYSLNVTVVPDGPLGYVTVWPTGQSQPTVSTLNSLDGRVKANAAIMPAGSDGSINVFASNGTQLVLDIDGYFIPTAASTLAFYPLSPCRIVDTRSANGPYLSGGSVRSFPIQGSCSIPGSAQAYSLNMTVVPHTALGYLTVWPQGETQPYVSTLNSLTGTTVANAAIVPAGSTDSGGISVFASNDTDLVIDVNGYFGPAGSGGLSLYALTPCRALDTRTSSSQGEFSGGITFNVGSSSCGTLTSAAQAFVMNATVVPPSPLGYLTLWSAAGTQPYVSTLNAVDGAVSSNMAIVPTNGSIDAFASNTTQLVLDLTGFFAP